jgi:hypothetical protein
LDIGRETGATASVRPDVAGQTVTTRSLTRPIFPVPAPKPSAKEVIPDSYLLAHSPNATTLGFVADRLANAIGKAGYTERVFMAASDGFALITRIERIAPDGSPRPNRFDVPVDLSRTGVFSFEDYLRALLTSNPGYFRVVVFLVTSTEVTQTDKSITASEALKWFGSGMDILPAEIRKIPYDIAQGFHCTALIYEFEREGNKPARFVDPSAGLGRQHLAKAGIWGALSQ